MPRQRRLEQLCSEACLSLCPFVHSVMGPGGSALEPHKDVTVFGQGLEPWGVQWGRLPHQEADAK